jgi:cathepsin F
MCSKISLFLGVCTYKKTPNAELTTSLVLAADASEEEKLFKEFMQTTAKVYDSEEESIKRFGIFVENLGSIKQAQMADAGATYSHLSPFADWTMEEFGARNTLKAHLFDKENMAQAPLLDVSDLPTSFDWREKGAVNPVKNQGGCGSCWAFSTVANIEGVNFLKTQQLLSLSEQELVDCDKKTGDQGCQGGLPSNAFKDMIENKIGLELESTYPYEGSDGRCKATQASEKVFISNWTMISTDEDQIAAALIKYGPLSIGINAGPMQFYFGGIANPWKIFCNPKSLDHGVAIVGFGEQSGKKYWIIRNSWGPQWGEKGYYRIIRGKGACGLNTMVATSSIGASDALGELVI